MGDSRTTTLIKHTGLYALGNIISKLMMFVLVPFYSFYIKAGEFGYYNLCLTTVLILGPVVAMQMKEGALRFLLEKKGAAEQDAVVAFILRRLLVNSLVFILVASVVAAVHPVDFLWYTVALTVAYMLQETLAQICRGLDRNMVFAVSGVVCAMVIMVVSVVLVAVFSMGIKGIFIGNIAGRFMSVIYMEWRVHIARRLSSPERLSRERQRGIIRYCLPLVAGMLLTWLINSSNVYFISYLCGLESMGQFAVAQKWGQIFESIAGIFFLGWQEMAMSHYDDADRDAYFSKIFNVYLWLYAFMVVGISFGVRFIYPWVTGAAYHGSAQYLFPIVFIVMLSYTICFYDVAYQCAKNTRRAFFGWLGAAVVVVAGNFLLGRAYGIYGILASSIFTYMFLLIYRVVDTRRYVQLRISMRSMLGMGVLLISFAAFYLTDSRIFMLGWLALSVAAFAALFPPFAREFLKSRLHRSKRTSASNLDMPDGDGGESPLESVMEEELEGAEK